MPANGGWSVRLVADCFHTLAFPGKGKVLARDYKKDGRFPVVDQGRERIAGWTDDEATVIDAPLPLVVFGDHTRALKFIDTPFARGADGTQILKPNDDIDPLFFLFACRSLNIPSRGYNRHFSLLREKRISVPDDKAEQEAIGRVLRLLEAHAEQQGTLKSTACLLKSTAMRELFTRGLRGEPQKETEIGPAPESWDIVTINDVATETQYGLYIRGQPTGRTPILGMNCQDDGRVVFRYLRFVDLDNETLAAYRLRPGDLLFNHNNNIDHVGRTALYESAQEAVFASYLIRISVNEERCLPRFLNYYLNRSNVHAEIKRLANLSFGRGIISATKLRTVAFPLPRSVDEQREIVAILDAIDRKIDLHRRKRALLEELFKSLLHKLMTREIRVADLDLSALPEAAAA